MSVDSKKITNYTVLGPPDESVRTTKITQYTVLGPPKGAVYANKITQYTVLGPKPPKPFKKSLVSILFGNLKKLLMKPVPVSDIPTSLMVADRFAATGTGTNLLAAGEVPNVAIPATTASIVSNDAPPGHTKSFRTGFGTSSSPAFLKADTLNRNKVNFGGTDPFTFEILIKPTETNYNWPIFLGTDRFRLYTTNATGQKLLIFQADTGDGMVTVFNVSMPEVLLNVWAHVALTRDAEGIVRAHYNGEMIAKVSCPVIKEVASSVIYVAGQTQGSYAGNYTNFRYYKNRCLYNDETFTPPQGPLSVVGGVDGDPFFKDVIFYSPCDTGNNAISFYTTRGPVSFSNNQMRASNVNNPNGKLSSNGYDSVYDYNTPVTSTIGNKEAFSVAGKSFTVEYWVKTPSTSDYNPSADALHGGVGQYDTANNKRSWHLGLKSVGTGSRYRPSAYFSTTGAALTDECNSDTILENNTWYHIAFTYNEDTKKAVIFINGEPKKSITVSGSLFDTDSPLNFLAYNTPVGATVNGRSAVGAFYNDVRITEAVRYPDEGFTPPTKFVLYPQSIPEWYYWDYTSYQFVADHITNPEVDATVRVLPVGKRGAQIYWGNSYTSLQNDNPPAGHSWYYRRVGVSGNVLTQALGKYVLSADADLLLPNTGPFTIELLFRMLTPPSSSDLLGEVVNGSNGRWRLKFSRSGGLVRFNLVTSGPTAVNQTSPEGIPAEVGDWCHLSMTRDAQNTVRVFLNGKLSLKVPNVTFEYDPGTTAMGFQLCSNVSAYDYNMPDFDFTNFRKLEDLCLYGTDEDFIPDTRAYPVGKPGEGDPLWDDVIILDKCDNRSAHPFSIKNTRVLGSASATTSIETDLEIVKFGNRSKKSTGGNNALTIAELPSGSLKLNGRSLTIEFWTYLNYDSPSYTGTRGGVTRGASGSTASYGIVMSASSVQTLARGVLTCEGGPVTLDSTPLPLKQWVHLAMTYDADSQTLRLFVNGVKVGESPVTTPVVDPDITPLLMLGGWSGNAGLPNQHIDEVRITYACRYTENFDPPTESFPTFKLF